MDEILNWAHERVAALALAYGLPSAGQDREFVDAGGLLTYAARRAALFQRAAHYVARLLAGASPADTPLDGPTVFDLVLNRRTAGALGLELSGDILQAASEVIG